MMTGGGRGRRGGATLARHGACLVTLLLASAMALTLAPVARAERGVTRLDQLSAAHLSKVHPMTPTHEMSTFPHMPGGQLL